MSQAELRHAVYELNVGRGARPAGGGRRNRETPGQAALRSRRAPASHALLSISPDVNNPAATNVTFDELNLAENYVRATAADLSGRHRSDRGPCPQRRRRRSSPSGRHSRGSAWSADHQPISGTITGDTSGTCQARPPGTLELGGAPADLIGKTDAPSAPGMRRDMSMKRHSCLRPHPNADPLPTRQGRRIAGEMAWW